MTNMTTWMNALVVALKMQFRLTNTCVCANSSFFYLSIACLIQSFPDHRISIFKDYEMKPGTRRPKVLVQTAGHVSGAAYFYQKSDVSDPPWPHNQVNLCLIGNVF